MSAAQLGLQWDPCWWIYALCDPREADPVKRVRYVGYTGKQPEDRFREHRRVANKESHHSARWVAKMQREGVVPLLEVLEAGADERDWREAEQKWIAYWKAKGSDLTNMTAGGDGVREFRHSEETKEKMKAAHRVISQETRDKLSAALKGHVPSAQARAKVAAANRIRVISDETREKHSKHTTAYWVKYRAEKIEANNGEPLPKRSHRKKPGGRQP